VSNVWGAEGCSSRCGGRADRVGNTAAPPIALTALDNITLITDFGRYAYFFEALDKGYCGTPGST
jgi:hypothetical protein